MRYAWMPLAAALPLASALLAGAVPHSLPGSSVAVRPHTAALGSGPFHSRSRKAAATTTYHVAAEGSDTSSGTATAPFRSVQRGVNAASAGDTILVHAGKYEGMVTIRSSGRPGQPIVLASAGDGEAVLTAVLKPVRCEATSPARERTITIPQGDDHIVIQGLTIVGGIDVSGTNNDALRPYVQDRTLPGRGKYDPDAADSTLPELGSDPADSIRIVRNVIERRGIDVTNSRRGVIADNEIRDIDCGTGGGIWLHRFDDKYHVVNNWIHDIAASTNHYMSEGIRLGSQSSYNLVEYNTVERTYGPGRGITADVHAGWNVYRYNVVRDANQGFSEQAGSWGNKWLYNVAQGNRKYGFNVYSKGGKEDGEGETPAPRRDKPPRRALRGTGGLRTPVPGGENDGTPRYVELRCNRSVDNPVDLKVGDVTDAVFANNEFSKVSLSPKLRARWSESRNSWDGSSEPPSENPRSSYSTCEQPARVGSSLAPR